MLLFAAIAAGIKPPPKARIITEFLKREGSLSAANDKSPWRRVVEGGEGRSVGEWMGE
jgi:hypothetical protein